MLQIVLLPLGVVIVVVEEDSTVRKYSYYDLPKTTLFAIFT